MNGKAGNWLSGPAVGQNAAMDTTWSRLAARIGALRYHRAVIAMNEAVRRVVEHRIWRRSGRALVSRLPREPFHRLQLLHARRPELIRVVLPIVLLFVLAMLWFGKDDVRVETPGEVSLPDFVSIENTAERKQAFVAFLRPIVEYENELILEQRKRLLELLEQLDEGDEVAGHERTWLAEQAELYRVKADDDLARARRLRQKIDIVPLSLTLAQAALESGWGTSRFAREGNNLFGQWCFESGCGIVPEQRPDHAQYEVESFDTVGGSVRSYLRNLNSHPAYEPVRRIRAEARSEGRQPTGMEMAAGLIHYAAIGETYVEHIRTVIRRNNLHRLAQVD